MIKRTIVIALFLFYWFHLNAQQQSSLKLKVETGLLWDSVEGKIFLSGPFLNIEPQLKTSKNTVLGIRLGFAINTQKILMNDPNQYFINNEMGSNGVVSLAPSFDYYFMNSDLRPHIGIGLTQNFLTTSKKGFNTRWPLDLTGLSVDNQVGFLIRGGFNLHKVVIGRVDFSKYILGITYNYIPKTRVNSPNEQNVGTVSASNIYLSIGHIFGNSKGSKH